MPEWAQLPRWNYLWRGKKQNRARIRCSAARNENVAGISRSDCTEDPWSSAQTIVRKQGRQAEKCKINRYVGANLRKKTRWHCAKPTSVSPPECKSCPGSPAWRFRNRPPASWSQERADDSERLCGHRHPPCGSSSPASDRRCCRA